MHRKLIRAQISTLGDDEVEVVMSTAALARDGHILIPQGCRLDNYRLNPIVLWSHDPDLPVGNAENVAVRPDRLTARVRFAPLGISPKADEVRGLTKAGVIRAVSIGFDASDGEPLDSKRPRGGQRFTVWELLELSFVSVPSDVGAVVTARALREGKTLSGANAAALREAHDLAERCRAGIAGVLGDAGELGAGGREDRDYRRRQAEALALKAPNLVDPFLDRSLRRREAKELMERQVALENEHAPALSRARRLRDLEALRRPRG